MIAFVLLMLVLGSVAIAAATALIRNVLIPWGRRLGAPVDEIEQMRNAQKALSLAVADLLVTIERDPDLVDRVGRDKLVAVYSASSNLPTSLTRT